MLNGPTFVLLFVKDLEVSATFYEEVAGFTRSIISPLGGVLFDAQPTMLLLLPFDASPVEHDVPQVGWGMQFAFGTQHIRQTYEAFQAAGVKIAVPLFDAGFGEVFTFADPDGYLIALHGPDEGQDDLDV